MDQNVKEVVEFKYVAVLGLSITVLGGVIHALFCLDFFFY